MIAASHVVAATGSTTAGDRRSPGRVAVIGGGLAGIAAALRCVDAGTQVTLYEARPRLGGLTHSFWRNLSATAGTPPGLWVDNGQHLFLRCCTAYRQFLDRLGVEHLTRLQQRLDIPVQGMAGPRGRQRLRTGRLRATRRRRAPPADSPAGDRSQPRPRRLPSGVPAPYHLAGALLRYPWLTPGDFVRLPRVVQALRRLEPGDGTVDAQDFRSWLVDLGQSPTAVEGLWNLIGIATLNAPPDQVSLSLAATVFRIGLLTDPNAADVGVPMVPLGQLHGEPAARQLGGAGAQVRTRTKVAGVAAEGAGWQLSAGDASGGHYDAVIIATPPPVTERLLPPGLIAQSDGWSERLGSSPIINLHLLLDRRVMDQPFLAMVGSEAPWIFDRTVSSGLARSAGSGRIAQYLTASVSAADSLVDLPVAQLRARFLPELSRLIPKLAEAELLDFFVTRERRATFRPAPGSAADRPAVTTSAPTLALAGAWTQTRWPATMEGAVRSGNDAAAAILDQIAQRQGAPA